MSAFPISISAMDDRLAILGTAGSGKTYLTTTAIEQLLHRGARAVCVDPLGVMWGLRLKADGKVPSGFNLPIFGGSHGDLPLTENAGALIGETVATMQESCIVDLSELPTKAAERRFMTAFLEAIYRHTDPTKVDPFHLIIDEADRFAPQKPPKGDETMLNRMEEIVRRGRVKGFIPWLITQRPAVLNKNVLSQADGLVLLKLTSSQDRDQVGAWIEGQADRAQGKAILGSLPAMQRGQGVVWIPGRGVLETVQFPKKATFDSSSAPKRGEKRSETALKPLDLGALKHRLATVEADTKANDPKALKVELTALRKQMAEAVGRKVVADPADLERAEQRGYDRGKQASAQAIQSALADAKADITRATDDLRQIFDGHLSNLAKAIPAVTVKPASNYSKPIPAQRQSAPKVNGGIKTTPHLPPGEKAVLIAAAQFNGIEREQLTVLTGYKRSSRDAYIQRLREKGYIEVSGSTVTITPEGNAALPADYEPLPTGYELQSYWLGRLPEGERRILEVLISAYPDAVERTTLDDTTGYKRSSRDAYLQRMKAKRLWDAAGSSVRASEELF